MHNFVPEKILSKIKQGFSAPDASWFKGESIDYVNKVIFNPHSRIFEYLDKKNIQLLITEHMDGKENRRLLIWSLLYFEKWLKQFL
jgi:asparagine synthase (glutamine-hydrolysing)